MHVICIQTNTMEQENINIIIGGREAGKQALLKEDINKEIRLYLDEVANQSTKDLCDAFGYPIQLVYNNMNNPFYVLKHINCRCEPTRSQEGVVTEDAEFEVLEPRRLEEPKQNQ